MGYSRNGFAGGPAFAASAAALAAFAFSAFSAFLAAASSCALAFAAALTAASASTSEGLTPVPLATICWAYHSRVSSKSPLTQSCAFNSAFMYRPGFNTFICITPSYSSMGAVSRPLHHKSYWLSCHNHDSALVRPLGRRLVAVEPKERDRAKIVDSSWTGQGQGDVVVPVVAVEVIRLDFNQIPLVVTIRRDDLHRTGHVFQGAIDGGCLLDGAGGCGVPDT